MTAKKATAKKATAKKATAKKATAKEATAKEATAKTPVAKKTTAKKSAAKKTAAASPYTDPALRERIKARITRGTRGGKAGQWSARKAQLLAHEYEAEGGGYRKGARSEGQRHLSQWTDEAWTTSDGERAQRAGGTTRYLPEKAWSKLSSGERSATNRKKVEGSRRGRQHVANTTPAKRARRAAASR